MAEVGATDSDVDESGVVLGRRDVTASPSSSSDRPAAKPTAKARPSRKPSPPTEAPTPPPPPVPPTSRRARWAPRPPPPQMLGGRGVTPGHEELGGPSGPQQPEHPPPPEMLGGRGVTPEELGGPSGPQQPEHPPPPEMLGGRGVTRGHEELGGPTGMCPQCRVPRSSCFRLGDWACDLCGQHNFPSKLVCTNYRCKARKGVTVVSAPMPTELPVVSATTTWCDSCRRPRSECWKPNDWECPYCKNHNYARKQVSRQSVCVCVPGWQICMGVVLHAFCSLLGCRFDMIHLDCFSTRGLALHSKSSPTCLSILSDDFGGSLRPAWPRACLDVFLFTFGVSVLLLV